MIPLMHFIPPPSPHWSAQHITNFFIRHQTGIRVGAVIMIVGWCVWAVWGATITLLIRQTEGPFPILTVSSVALVGAATVFNMVIPMTWGVAAFRAGHISPQITQTLNDWVWFDFLFNWSPFSLWCFVIAIAIFNDRTLPQLYPRWVAYYNVWAGICFVPAGLIIFFKHGPFAINGALSFWFPAAVFFSWVVMMSVLTLAGISRLQIRAATLPAR
jgi:hypothetical protein